MKVGRRNEGTEHADGNEWHGFWKCPMAEMKHRVCSVCSVFTSVLIQSANICHLPCASHGARLYTRNSPASLWTKLKGFVQLPSPQRERRSMYGTFDNDPLAYLKFGSRTYLKFHIPLTKV